MYQARSRALRRGLPFEITVEWALQKLVAQGYRCAKTGIALQLVCPHTDTTYSAFSPSFDRINSSLGYTCENTQVVCLMYNSAKNRFSDEDVSKFAEALVMRMNIANDNTSKHGALQ